VEVDVGKVFLYYTRTFLYRFVCFHKLWCTFPMRNRLLGKSINMCGIQYLYLLFIANCTPCVVRRLASSRKKY
jgi:hypothetical protein